MNENRKIRTNPLVPTRHTQGRVFALRTVFHVFHISWHFGLYRNAMLDADALWQQDRRR